MKNLLNNPITLESVATGLGTLVGLFCVSAASLLIGALAIHLILTTIGIGSFTYIQVVGLYAIWEIVKPSSSKS